MFFCPTVYVIIYEVWNFDLNYTVLKNKTTFIFTVALENENQFS